jgi:hypothetical protein
MTCPEGRTSDLFTHNCALPIEVLRVLGALALILDPLAIFLAFIAICRSKRSFWGRDVHFKLVVVMKIGLFLVMAVFSAPLASQPTYWSEIDRKQGHGSGFCPQSEFARIDAQN